MRLHSAAGWAFLILTIFAIFWMLVTGQSRQFVPVRNNIKSQIMYYISGIFKKEPHPVKKTADSKLNPLQRIIYFGLIILVFPVQLITGFSYLFFHYPDKPIAFEGLEAIAVLHTLGAFLLVRPMEDPPPALALLPGLLLVIAAVAGLVVLGLTPLVLKLRKTQPPPLITRGAMLVGAAPSLLLVMIQLL